MPRNARQSDTEITDLALKHFWANGYNGTSMDDLVKMTGTSRHAIYSGWGGKRQLYLACFPHYQDSIVSPGFKRVEAEGAGIADIRDYFAFQIEAAQRLGLQGLGCFVANATTETAPHDKDVRVLVEHHRDRLTAGFAHALAGTATATRVNALAGILTVFATGLWAHARIEGQPDRLLKTAETLVTMIEGQCV